MPTVSENVPRPIKAERPAARQIAWLARESIASAPQEAFEFAFRPSESLLHRFAFTSPKMLGFV
jgi:hypothetical protein